MPDNKEGSTGRTCLNGFRKNWGRNARCRSGEGIEFRKLTDDRQFLSKSDKKRRTLPALSSIAVEIDPIPNAA
jgi:hypothetical protein